MRKCTSVYSWFWRTGDGEKAPKDTQWVKEKFTEYFSMNCAFMLNLSPDCHGRVEENLAAAFGEIGRNTQLPGPLQELPEGWLRRISNK